MTTRIDGKKGPLTVETGFILFFFTVCTYGRAVNMYRFFYSSVFVIDPNDVDNVLNQKAILISSQDTQSN